LACEGSDVSLLCIKKLVHFPKITPGGPNCIRPAKTDVKLPQGLQGCSNRRRRWVSREACRPAHQDLRNGELKRSSRVAFHRWGITLVSLNSDWL
jgi:hypothetical protein